MLCHNYIVPDKRLCNLVSRVDRVIVRIDDVVFLTVFMVTLMAVALMSVQIDDQEALKAEPLFHIVRDERDVWIDAEAATLITSRMMVASRQVDGPALFSSDACSID